MSDTAQDQARAQYESIVSMLAAVECDYSRLEELREYIVQDPLSVEIRSDWTVPGGAMEASEFRILLCTGGPAVQIRGELDRGTPCRVWIEYQDWGTPWAQLFDTNQDTLIQYASCFFFGE